MDSSEKTNQNIIDEAIDYAKKNKKRIAKELTNVDVYPPEENPVSVFMAGSPGAGKTEASISLIENAIDTTNDNTLKVLRIDADELRVNFERYNGLNSSLFQRAVSILVEKIHDLALKNSQSFVLDGTLSSYGVAKKNIERSLSRGRVVLIIYVYQDPTQAWAFVKARERVDGRKVAKETFIEQYFEARQVVNRLKTKYEKSIEVDLLLKNTDGTPKFYKANVDNIDTFISESHTREELENILDIN